MLDAHHGICKHPQRCPSAGESQLSLAQNPGDLGEQKQVCSRKLISYFMVTHFAAQLVIDVIKMILAVRGNHTVGSASCPQLGGHI